MKKKGWNLIDKEIYITEPIYLTALVTCTGIKEFKPILL